MLFHSPRLEALPLSVCGYGREVIIRIGFSCVDGGFPKKTKMPTWFGFMKYQLFFGYEGLDVVFTVYLSFFWKGVNFFFFLGFLGQNLGCMPWIFPLAS